MSVIMAPGEKRVFYTTVSASLGTLTITNPTFDFQAYDRTPIATDVPATGQDDPAASVRAWYDFDTVAPPGGGAPLQKGGLYWINWRLPVSNTADGLVRIECPSELLIINE